ncbi:glutamate receptor ionotropic, kainate 5 [Eurytemora carolleeae]|uniref:glutamate receptor ionotropic, kainate 5 n=1 Tax=Eurytemora carolleeae TaxID=1294199 RepID=UPI000C77C0A3|nr:glutamate receptor ionotropic, kainate 5 [Eurytemora carolleeae]|eukprot:XP_023339113.1 glutamate receptor ionotropic, kainate 5-like [Eurytemora affinis]
MEWVLLDPCDKAEEPDIIEQELYVNHCLWWAWATIMWMGCEVAPKAMSTRMMAGSWYLFTLVMVSSYTANLAASLTAENMVSPISTAKDLAHQTSIEYGCVQGGSTCSFFQNSDDSSYAMMWNYMVTHPTVFSRSNPEGIERVVTTNGGWWRTRPEILWNRTPKEFAIFKPTEQGYSVTARERCSS